MRKSGVTEKNVGVTQDESWKKGVRCSVEVTEKLKEVVKLH